MAERPVLLFDLDGTLIDSVPDIIDSLNGTLALYDRPPVTMEAGKKMVGDGSRKLVERGFQATGGLPMDLDRLQSDFLKIYEAGATHKTVPFPNVIKTLDQLQAADYVMAVCTNKPLKATHLILEQLALAPYFTDVAGGDSFAVKKPDPGHITQLLDRMGLSNHPAVMIGDSENDILSGQRAGLPTILLSFGYCRVPLESLNADHLLDDFLDIPAIVESLHQAA